MHWHTHNNKKLIRRWDSERDLSLRRHCTHTKNAIDSCINSATDSFLQRRFTKCSEITQCNAIQCHSRSPILVPIESSDTQMRSVVYHQFCHVFQLLVFLRKSLMLSSHCYVAYCKQVCLLVTWKLIKYLHTYHALYVCLLSTLLIFITLTVKMDSHSIRAKRRLLILSSTQRLYKFGCKLQLGSTKPTVTCKPISQLPKLCVKITIFMQGHVLIADWSVAHFVVIMNDVMNDNMAAFAHVGARLGAFFYWTRFLENNVPFDNIPL